MDSQAPSSPIVDENYQPPDGSDIPDLEYLPEYKDTKKTPKVEHSHDYFGSGANQNKRYFRKGFEERDEEDEMIVYTKPGKARALELNLPPDDPRAGKLPQHNSQGEFDPNMEIRPTRDITVMQGLLYHADTLPQNDYFRAQAVITQKRLYELHQQFFNLNYVAFKHMIGIDENSKDKRDFEIWVKQESELEYSFIYTDEETGFANFMEIIKKDEEGIPMNVVYTPFHKGQPVVMAETYRDDSGRLRNIAHIGIAGAASVNNTKTDRRSGLERFDDGTLLWTLSSFKKGRCTTGAAALRPDGSVILMPQSQNKKLAQAAARSFGAEGINPSTEAWTGKFSIDGCVSSEKDKYPLRTDYKSAVRNQTSALIDGSCIPGLLPIFEPRMKRLD